MIRALNKIKLQRAIASCAVDATEEEIKAAYLKLGGALEGEQSAPILPNKIVVELPEVEVIPEPVAEKPKKVVKVAKKPAKKK